MSEKVIEKNITEAAEEYVRELLFNQLDRHYVFHNFGYAKELAEQAEKLAGEAGLEEEARQQLMLAALFLFTGYVEDKQEVAQHGAALAEQWLEQQQYPDAVAVADLIRHSTDEVPADELSVQLLHDVRYAWLGRKRFSDRANLLRLEEEFLRGETIDPADWERDILELLVQTRYLTPAGQERYGERKMRNLTKQRENVAKAQKESIKRKTGKDFGRGIDTLYRTSFRNHINLSRIADGKANMMISINTIILSILLAISGAGISFFEEIWFQNPGFILPIITLILSSLTAVIFAVFSARPKVTEYKIRKRKLGTDKQEASLLYFGNFLQLEKTDFIHYLDEMKEDQERLYDDLARDLYDLGQVLQKKYALLTISYNTFVGGLILSVMIFLVVYMLSVF